MKFNTSTIIKALAFSAAVAIAASAQTNVCWNDRIPAGAGAYVSKFSPGKILSFQHVSANITTNTTWTKNNYYFLDRDINVMPGATLTVEPGTWIFAGTWQYTHGQPTQPVYAYGSSLIIQRGAKAIMKGKADSMIVMTGYGDDPRDINTFGPGAMGMWGGLVVAGYAPVSNYLPIDTMLKFEGMGSWIPTSMKLYGGTVSDDSSGVFEYVSIRHGGCANASASEINALSLYAVGSKTVVNNIEVYATFDDGIEVFGGSVNMKNLVIAYQGDDGLDFDQGYNGKIQFVFQSNLGWMGNRCGEWDGKKSASDPGTTSNPTIANVTLLGSGKASMNNYDDHDGGNNHLLCFADSLKGTFRNILLGDGPKWALGFYKEGHSLPKDLGTGGLDLQGVIAFNMGGGNNWNTLFTSDAITGKIFPKATDVVDSAARYAYLSNPANKCNVIEPNLRGISREVEFAALDPRPCAGSPALNASYYAATPSDPFFTYAPYVGAFGASDLWCNGWTKLSQAGILSGLMSTGPTELINNFSSNLEICYQINSPTLYPTGVLATLDGINITNDIIPILVANNGAMDCGGTWLKLTGIPMSTIVGLGISCGGSPVNYTGLHVLNMDVTLNDGSIVKGSTKFKISK